MKPYNWLEATVVGLLRKQGFFVTFAPEDASLIGTGCPSFDRLRTNQKTAERYYPDAPEDASLVGTGSVGICDPHLSAAALI
jgi:hypothetical protein